MTKTRMVKCSLDASTLTELLSRIQAHRITKVTIQVFLSSKEVNPLEREKLPSTTRNGIISHIGVTVDSAKQQAFMEGQALSLTPSEFRLLAMFVSQPGRAFTRGELMKVVSSRKKVDKKQADSLVKTLRRKLGCPEFIEAVRAFGYRFRETPLKPPGTTGQ